MDCKVVLERLHEVAALRGDAAAAEHLARCPACRRAVTRAEALTRLLRTMPREPAPSALDARVLGGLSRRPRRVPRLAVFAAACALILIVMAGALLMPTGPSWEPIPLRVVRESSGAAISEAAALEILYGPAESSGEGPEETFGGAEGR